MQPSAKALVLHNHQLLLFLRDNNPAISDPNKWNLLGGTIEEGETAIDALKRELKEEANIEAEDINDMGHVDTWNGRNYMYIVKIDDSTKSNLKLGDEGQELRFFTLEELEKIAMSKNLHDFFHEYKDQIKDLLLNDTFFTLK